MSQNRSERQPLLSQTPIVAEVLRQASEEPKPKDKEEDKGIPVFWRIFGGTLLSITSVVVISAYQGLTASLNEIRTDLTHLTNNTAKDVTRFTEAQSELIPKDEFGSNMTAIWSNINEIKAERKELAALRERCNSLMDQHRAGQKERQQMLNEVQKLREQQAGDAERRELVKELQTLRERLAVLESKRPKTKTHP